MYGGCVRYVGKFIYWMLSLCAIIVDSESHGTRTCIKRQKIAYGKFFDFWADDYIYKRIPEDENPPIKGF